MCSIGTGNTYELATRAQVVALKEVGFTKKQILEITGVSERQVVLYYSTALSRGYNPARSKVLKDEYFVDASRSGRPLKRTEEVTAAVVAEVYSTRATRSFNLESLARRLRYSSAAYDVSKWSVWRILR